MLRCRFTSLVCGFLLCQQIVHGLPALTLPATITVNAAGGSSPGNLDAISSGIGSDLRTTAQQMLGGELSSQSGQLNGGSVGGALNVEGLQGLSGLTTGSLSGLGSNGMGLTSGGLRSFSVTSGNGAGATSAFTSSGSNGGSNDASSSPSTDTENTSQGTATRTGFQQLSPTGQLVTSFITRTQPQNDGISFDSYGQRVLSFASRPEGISSSGSNVVPQGSWVLDLNSFGDATTARNNFLASRLNGFPEQSTSPNAVQSTQSPIAATWSARQQAVTQSPINPNYLQEYVVQSRPPTPIYYSVADAQNPNIASARSLGYSVRNSDGLQLQYARNGGVYTGPINGQGYFTGGQAVPSQQFQLAV